MSNINQLLFNKFVDTLLTTNRDLAFFVDWKKCIENKDDISVSINHLNYLIGNDNIKERY